MSSRSLEGGLMIAVAAMSAAEGLSLLVYEQGMRFGAPCIYAQKKDVLHAPLMVMFYYDYNEKNIAPLRERNDVLILSYYFIN
jgi:hypothetical protein